MSELGPASDRRRIERGRAAVIAVLALVAAAVVAVLLIFRREGDEPVPSPASVAEPEPVAELPRVVTDGSVVPLAAEVPAVPAAEPATLAPEPPSVAATAPQRFAVQAVDDRGRAIEAAVVTVVESGGSKGPNLAQAEKIKTWAEMPDGPEKQKALADMLGSLHQVKDPDGKPVVYETGADGWCRFSAPGEVLVSVEKEGVGTSGEWKSEPSPSRRKRNEPEAVAAGEERRVRLELLRQATIEGHVLDRDGRPLGGATVTVSAGFSWPRKETSPRSPAPLLSGEDGSYSVRVDAPGNFDLNAEAGALLTAKEEARVEPGGHYTVDLRVPGAFAVTGRVETSEGAPVAGASLELDSTWRDEKATSGADGRFEILLPSGDEYGLTADAKGLVQDLPVSVALTTDQPTAEVVVRMIPTQTISGVVRWSDGSPGSRVSVEAQPRPREGQPEFSWRSRTHSMSKEDGSFVLEGIHPSYAYTVSAVEFRPAIARASLADVAAGSRDIELVLSSEETAGLSVAGQVVDAITGLPVTEYELEYGGWIRGLHGGDSKSIRDDAGRFRLEGLSEYEQALVVKAEGYPPKTVGPLKLTPESGELLIKLEHLGGVTVRAIDETGAPVPGAIVHAHRAVSDEEPDLFTEWFKRETQADGQAVWAELAPGHYFFQAAEGERLSDVTYATVVGGQSTTVTVTLESTLVLGTLEVRVQHSDGRPAEGVSVAIRNMTGLGLGRAVGAGAQEESKLSAQGSEPLVFTGLLPGQYWVWPDIEDQFISPDWVVVPAGRTTTALFQLE